MFLITNFDNFPGYITLDKINSADSNAGSTNCCPQITSISPSDCGLSDGSIVVELLSPNTAYVINYNDPNPQTFSANSDADGTITIPNLPAGSYTNIDTQTSGCSPRDFVLSDASVGAFNSLSGNGEICFNVDAIFN